METRRQSGPGGCRAKPGEDKSVNVSAPSAAPRGFVRFAPILPPRVMKPGNEARIDGHDAGALAELACVKHRRFAKCYHRNVDHRARLVEAGILKMTDHKRVVAFALGSHRVADHFPRAPEFDDRMRVIVVRSDALDIDRRAGIDECGEMAPQPVPIDFAVRLVDVTLIPNPDRVHFLPNCSR